MANTFKFGNEKWAVGKETALAYNDENSNFKPLPFTFDRGSIGTVVNKDGLIETVGTDEPRIDFLNNTKGHLLLEPSRSNLETKSNEFSTWSLNSNITRTADYIISPDGTLNGTRMQFTANGYVGNTTQVNTTQYTISCYAKRNDSGAQNVGFFINGSGIVSSVWEITGEWKRFTYTYTSGNTSFAGIAGISGADISVYGFQLEQGSYATSYIPTSGSAVTRSAETCNGAGNSTVFNDSEGVLFAEIAVLEGDTSVVQLSLSNGTDNENIKLLQLNSTTVRAEVKMSAESNFVEDITIDAENLNKFAVQYKADDYKVFVNGIKQSVGQRSTTPTGLDTLNFDRGDGASDFYGKIKDLRVYNTALTDAELIALTS